MPCNDTVPGSAMQHSRGIIMWWKMGWELRDYSVSALF